VSQDGLITCRARDAADNLVQCTAHATGFPSFARNASAFNEASAVVLYWNRRLECTDMRLIQGSQFLPDYHDASVAPGFVTVAANYAEGALGPVRYNVYPDEFISCDLWASGSIYCTARDKTGAVASCNANESANPLFADAVRSIDSVSRVRFSFAAGSGTCTAIIVNKSSDYVP
jgi:hypothetical protein